ncbi:hypothetical protein [Rhodocyclus tenuis]|uniref:hypothetical protein n=1 Tax=Rhodocyclus tenuis TaxID=1066 RepID=UPI0019067BEC|nr:hypothetical protein [Rhodocyclus tenuis]MBK1680439.1 hypothetical protein [Rhodocyclus tenuis]
MSLLHALRRDAASPRRLLLTLWLALALVGAQAHVLAHEFSHWQGKAPPAETHSCVACLAGHALDTPLAASALPPALADPPALAAPAPHVGLFALRALPARARGPPA